MVRKALCTSLMLGLLLAGAPATARTSALETRAAPMPLRFVRPHTFSRMEAAKRLHQLLDYWSQRYGVQQAWSGNQAFVTGHIMGIPVQARLVVGESEVVAQATDPGFFLRGMAVDYINRKLGKYLHPTYQER